jgi:hypothetical protein
MGETIMILSPDRRREQDVERSDLVPPFDFETLLDPFAMLVDHGVDDVDEGLVAVEQAMAAGQNVTLEPALGMVSFEHEILIVQHTSTVCSERISITRPS